MTTTPGYSARAIQELQTAYLRISAPMSAQRLWERVLTPCDRARLGGNFPQAWSTRGTIGMWIDLHGVSGERATIDVAKHLNLLDDATAQWLLREIGDNFDDPEATIATAAATSALVLVESPRTVYWRGQQITIDWSNLDKPWDYLWTLALNSKRKQPIDRFSFGEEAYENYVVHQKSRLSKMEGFPLALIDCIQRKGRGSQQLNLPGAQIRLFQMESIDRLQEVTG